MKSIGSFTEQFSYTSSYRFKGDAFNIFFIWSRIILIVKQRKIKRERGSIQRYTQKGSKFYFAEEDDSGKRIFAIHKRQKEICLSILHCLLPRSLLALLTEKGKTHLET